MSCLILSTAAFADQGGNGNGNNGNGNGNGGPRPTPGLDAGILTGLGTLGYIGYRFLKLHGPQK